MCMCVRTDKKVCVVRNVVSRQVYTIMWEYAHAVCGGKIISACETCRSKPGYNLFGWCASVCWHAFPVCMHEPGRCENLQIGQWRLHR